MKRSRDNFSELAILLDERMSNLEEQYGELKMLVKQGSSQSYIANPALLEHWNPGDMVIRYSPWTTVRLVLNKVASENITDLFPSDWHPRPIMSTDDEKQYKVITELMTHMFQQCGYLQEENIIELDNYQDFLKTLQHHVFMGNVSVTQMIHFMILMVYMSFCRLNHYTEYMSRQRCSTSESSCSHQPGDNGLQDNILNEGRSSYNKSIPEELTTSG